MVIEFKFPDVGEGITEGELIKWLVKEGDSVKLDQPLGEVETDKAAVEIPSPVAGTILKLHFKEGDTMNVGDVMVTIGEKGEKAPAAGKEKAPEEAPVKEEKAPEEAPAKEEPVKKEPKDKKKKVGASVVGELPEAPEEEAPEKAPEAPAKEKAGPSVKAIPAVRKAAKEKGIDLSTINGTGPGGVITMKDLAGGTAAPKAKREARVGFERFGRVIRIPYRGMRRTIGKNMVKYLQTIAQVTHMDEADVTDLWALREREKQEADNRIIHLTFLPFIMKSVIIGLKKYPYVNSSLDDEKEEIVLKKYFNIGFAVDTGMGLIVPVVKQADQKSIFDIARDMQTYSEEAKDRTIELKNLQGGTFTITNIGSIGGMFATPIVNHPEVAILAVGRIYEKPLVKKGKILIKKMLPLSLSFDHRVMDGALAARFTNEVKKHLESPDLLLVDIV